MRGLVAAAGAVVLAAACASSERAPAAEPVDARGAVRVALLGDVMLGRGVGDVVAHDPASVFEQLRPALVGADLALANLESPLTDRPHRVGPYALEADPAAAAPLLAGAGLDAVSIANNHAGDAGPGTVTDTMAALAAEGLDPIGAGDDITAATRPLVVERSGVRIAVLAFDLTGGGPPAGAGPGVAAWEPAAAEAAIAEARRTADLVVVGIHAGLEYAPRPDPVLRRVVARLTDWGVDVVWGSGAHVAYPVTVGTTPGGRPSVQAPGLGNALFDQRYPSTDEGLLLEVLADDQGVIAYRTGPVASYLRSRFLGWDAPSGDAVALDGDWWSLARAPEVVDPVEPSDPTAWLAEGATLVDAAVGDADGDGTDDVVPSYREAYRPRVLHDAFPDHDFADPDGRTAHLRVHRASDGLLIWGAGTMLQPAAAVAVCDGALALGFSTLDDPSVTSGGAWIWSGFGFNTAPVLDGPAHPGCADVDGDGLTEPILTGRTPTGT